MDIYEFSLREKFTVSQISKLLGDILDIPLEFIGSQTEYFSRCMQPDTLLMGIDIVYQATGYRTFINVVLTDDIDDQRFIETSCLLASTLKTDVAIGDLSDTNGFPGIFIKIDSSLQIQRGYERYDDNGNFDLDLVAIPMSLNDYLLMLSS